MKILIACLNVNGLGGSELYHYELCRELQLLPDINITLLTLRPIDKYDQVRKKLYELGVNQIDITLPDLTIYDIIVASQPSVNQYVLDHYKSTPIISIIHSELRSEDPVIHDRIVHYIAIRETIKNMLINTYNIPSNKISVIYNPIDTSRYNQNDIFKYEKTTGIYIGNVNDPLRRPSIEYMINKCIEMNWDLIIMSKYDINIFTHTNIIHMLPRWDNEQIVKHCHFTAGILLGRTTLEGIHCGVPGFIFDVDKHGRILKINSDWPSDIIKISDSKYVSKKHIELIEQIVSK